MLNGHVEAGTDEAVEAGLGGSAGWQGGGALLSGSWFDSGDKQGGSSRTRAQGLARVRQSIGSFDVRAIGLYAHSDHSSFPEDSGGPLLAVNRDLERGKSDLAVAGLTAGRTSGTLRPNLTISYTEQRDDTATPAIAPGALDSVPALTAKTRFTRFEAIADLLVESGIFTGAIGGGVRRETGRSDGTIDFGFLLPVSFALDRTIWSGFAEATLRPAPSLTLNLAGHYDQVTDGPHEWTGRAGIAWQPLAKGPALYARIGDGFKLPSFYALGHPLVGNPDLLPERSRNVEAGLEWSWGPDTKLRLSWYENHFRDLIDFDPVLFKTVNRASVIARGLEGEASLRVAPTLVLNAALGHVVLDSDTPLRGRPEWQGSTHAVWTIIPPLELNAALRFNSSFYDSSVPTGLVRTQGHAEADLGLRYRLTKTIGLTVALRNIGDSHYQDAVGWPALGRQLDVGVSARLF
jgi:iron complex outermembrane receptor protein/vitamin B12 transporter